MFRSLLLSCLFFGLISMILPYDRRSEWMSLLLIAVLMLSFVGNFSAADWVFPESEEIVSETSEVLPEAAALRSAVSSEIFSLTGEPPVSVESDLEKQGDSYSLTQIRVVIRVGNEKEVQDALQKAFSFQGFTVIREETDRSDGGLNLSP